MGGGGQGHIGLSMQQHRRGWRASSRSQVSRLCAETDERAGASLGRSIWSDRLCVRLDDADVKVRRDHQIVSIAGIISVGGDTPVLQTAQHSRSEPKTLAHFLNKIDNRQMSESASVRTRTETRVRILAAAGRLFDRYGPVKTTVSEIAREAGMSSANIYNFFKSRDDIIEAVGEMYMADLRHKLIRGLPDKATAWDGICTLFLEILRHARDHLANEKDLLRLQLLRRQNGWEFVTRLHDFVRAQLEALLRRGTASGEFGDVDPAATASILFDCMVAAVDPLLIMRIDQVPHERQVKAQLDFLRRALR